MAYLSVCDGGKVRLRVLRQSFIFYARVLWAAMDARLSMHLLGNRLLAIETTVQLGTRAHGVSFLTVDFSYVIGVFHTLSKL